jgi:hypothetical protein
MRARNGRNLVPENRARSLHTSSSRAMQDEVRDTLGIKMNFTMLFVREVFEQFGESALGAVAAIDERTNDCEPQVSASTGGEYWRTD